MTVVFEDAEWEKMVEWIRDLGTGLETFSFQFDPRTGECQMWQYHTKHVLAVAEVAEEVPR